MTQLQKKASKSESFVIMKILFKRNMFGITWLVGELVDFSTKISGEINVAEQLKKIKPRIRIIKP